MNAHQENRIKKLLKQALPPVATDAEPDRDLWPAVLRRLRQDRDADPAAILVAPRSRSLLRVPFFDWALLAGLVIFAASFPATIPLFLYYL